MAKMVLFMPVVHWYRQYGANGAAGRARMPRTTSANRANQILEG